MNRSTPVKKYDGISMLIIGVIIIATVSVGWWAWVNFSPKPLGDKMEYLGKEDFGNILGFDTHPYSVYYYGTDMTKDEVITYFSKATLNYQTQEKANETLLNFTLNGKEFFVTYYKDLNVFRSKSQTGISIDSFHYADAQKSL